MFSFMCVFACDSLEYILFAICFSRAFSWISILFGNSSGNKERSFERWQQLFSSKVLYMISVSRQGKRPSFLLWEVIHWKIKPKPPFQKQKAASKSPISGSRSSSLWPSWRCTWRWCSICSWWRRRSCSWRSSCWWWTFFTFTRWLRWWRGWNSFRNLIRTWRLRSEDKFRKKLEKVKKMGKIEKIEKKRNWRTFWEWGD
jgi:hypothetical protein